MAELALALVVMVAVVATAITWARRHGLGRGRIDGLGPGSRPGGGAD